MQAVSPRRLKAFLKGDRCYSEKCSFERRGYAPGDHGQSHKKQQSDYGTQLREKQKLKRMYGLLEKQFHGYFEKADRQKGITGTNLLVLLDAGWTIWCFALVLPIRESKPGN